MDEFQQVIAAVTPGTIKDGMTLNLSSLKMPDFEFAISVMSDLDNICQG